MSPVVRTGLIFGAATVGAILGTQLLSLLSPLLGCLGFISVILLGLGAGYSAAKDSNATREQRIARGATAGAIAGVITLIGAVLVIVLVSQMPAFQAAQQAQLNDLLQSNPDAAGLDPEAISTFATGAGVVGGFCGGIMYFVVMLICGLLGSLFWKGAAGQYVAAGGSYASPPTMTGGTGYNAPNQSYGSTPDDSGARVYDAPNDPDRPS